LAPFNNSGFFGRSQDRFQALYERILENEKRIDFLQEQINRMPLEYVLKVDFLRELQQMQDNFKQINMKLDKLIERL
jgi:hypothetical protein